MTKPDVISFVVSCRGDELIEILSQALPRRQEPLNANGLEQHLVLCMASRLADRASPDYEGWDFKPIADQYPEDYLEREPGEPFLQSGS